ncbi:acetoacetate--CoA ligase [Halomonas piscis]|uniref:Acetoacetate--CoA ligase n=1 Tax=Halomonas piscis TaxID=3031727 RepID=A0ABY9YYD3_9GAMM|nr:acetoacetate--CoA ligase [Halomonas piscis]WNK19063.1 acetoacetate--CoA ligase [Halomonas piscis]
MSYTDIAPTRCWAPSKRQRQATQMMRFARQVGLDNAGYADLHRYSVACLEDFWAEFWDFAQLRASAYNRVLTAPGGKRMMEARFFDGATINFAENMLAGDPDSVAVIETDERGLGNEVTLAELRARVAGAQQALRRLGVEENDRVAGLMPNTLDTLVMVLATASIGAIWSVYAPEFGVSGVLDRFGQIAPKILVAVSRYRYNGRTHELGERIGTVARTLGVEQVLLTNDDDLDAAPAGVSRLGELAAGSAEVPDYPRFDFNHPLCIIYTSGTTGLPKCIVHSTGGTLIEHRKEHMLHCDIGPGDRVLYYTSTAWMMYNWMITTLASGAALVLYDGAAVPKIDAEGNTDTDLLWRLAAATGATHFGTSPQYLKLMMDGGYRPGETHDLSALRMILTSGAPLTANLFDWVYDAVSADLCLASISGGTEILGCFVMGNPAEPVYRGEIQGPGLGMAMAVVDERDIPVFGREGDIVCTEPFPSMPLAFWGENGRQRYLDTYFSDRDDVWTHGDVGEMRPTGGVVITGRSDTMLKPGGVRMGPSEIYRVVEALDGVDDSVVVGYPTGDGNMDLWLFVVPAGGGTLDDALRDTIRQRLRAEASPRHVPKRIFAVTEVPYTFNGKKVEKAVLQLVTGKPVKNSGSLRNPDCLDEYAAIADDTA